MFSVVAQLGAQPGHRYGNTRAEGPLAALGQLMATERRSGGLGFVLRMVPAVRFSIYSRALVPAYLLRRSVLAWECSVCHKMFCLSVDEAQCNSEPAPPPCVAEEFRLHSCELVLIARQEKWEHKTRDLPDR